jgi:hypothetical protein
MVTWLGPGAVACGSSGSGRVCPAARRGRCHVRGGDRRGHDVSVLVAGGRSAAGHPPKGPIAADISVATEFSLSACAGHQPSGRR